jgi:hypothetical protein
MAYTENDLETHVRDPREVRTGHPWLAPTPDARPFETRDQREAREGAFRFARTLDEARVALATWSKDQVGGYLRFLALIPSYERSQDHQTKIQALREQARALGLAEDAALERTLRDIMGL